MTNEIHNVFTHSLIFWNIIVSICVMIPNDLYFIILRCYDMRLSLNFCSKRAFKIVARRMVFEDLHIFAPLQVNE